MRQSFHILKKDVRYLSYEIAILFFFVAAFTISASRRSSARPDIDGPIYYLLRLGLILAGAYLITRLIHAEPLPGEHQFWVTRPYRWRSLLGAKAMFVVIFVSFPMLIADAVILRTNGFSVIAQFPGLLWSQVLLTAAIVLPIAALATITKSIVEVFITVLAFVALVVAKSFLMWGAGIAGPSDWVGTSLAIAAIVMVFCAVVARQYSRRRTGSSRVLAILGVCAAVGATMIPFRTQFAIQSYITNRIDASRIQVTLSDESWPVLVSQRNDQTLLIPRLRLSGVGAGLIVRSDGLTIRMEAPDGTTATFEGMPWMSYEGASGWPQILIDRRFVEKVGDRPVRISGSVFLTLYGNEQKRKLTFDSKPVLVPGAGLCVALPSSLNQQVVCRYPFRNPPNLVTIFFAQAGREPLGARLSYSPFPAQLDDGPISMYSASVLRDHPPPATIVAGEPLAHIRRDFDVRSLRLGGT